MTGRTPEKRRVWRKDLLERAEKDPGMRDRAGHGRLYTYRDLGCRCQPCRDVSAEAWMRGYWHRMGRLCDSPSCGRCALDGEP